MELDTAMENFQDSDNKIGRIVTNCLGTSEVLSRILENFSTTELIKMSLVNKQWSYEARSLMRNRGNLMAAFHNPDSFDILQDFASDLRRMKEMTKVVPFSGLSFVLGNFNWDHDFWCEPSSSEELAPVVSEILGIITLKHLSVRLSQRWEKSQKCPGYLLARNIMPSVCWTLEELSIFVESSRGYFIQEFLHNSSFPHLQTLKLQDEFETTSEDYTTLIKRLVSCSPNLQVLRTQGRVNLKANLLEGSSAVHVTDYPYSPSLCHNEIPKSALGSLRMQQMNLSSFNRDFNMERFNSITSMLLQTFCTTLSSMQVGAIFLVPLTYYGIRLENVRIFEINFHSRLEFFEPRLRSHVESFDFTHIFPNLSSVGVTWTRFNESTIERISNDLIDLADQENPVFIQRQPGPDRAANIKSLSLQWQHAAQQYSWSPFLAQIFPCIRKLCIETDEIPFAGIWDTWQDLEELDVEIYRVPRLIRDLDGAFCGIFPQEVAELREESEEYLRKVNIVPVMPSITCFKNLRTFKLGCMISSMDGGFYDDPNYLISKVTGLVAFERCPGLAITLTADTTRLLVKVLRQIEPHALVVPF